MADDWKRRLTSGGVRTTPFDVNAWKVPSAPAQGAGVGTPGSISSGQQADVARTQFPPIYVPPAGAQNFFLAGNQTFGPGPTAFVVFNGPQASFQLPQGMSGVIRGFTFIVNNLLVTSQIAFQILGNGNPLSGYGNLLMPQAGLAVYLYSPDAQATYIKVPSGQLITVAAMVTDAVPYALSFEMRGWMYNKTIDDQWRGVV